ncbi:MAG: prmA [Acidobacteria bacterium]|nr:prmA [Acidobacteriota bacterium]
MIDYILDLSFDARDTALEEQLQARLFVSRSTGSSSAEINGTATVSAYFDSIADRDEAARAFENVEGLELTSVDRERVDWLEQYQQSLEPLFIGDRFVVAPDAALIPDDGRMSIIVPQEQAFGTGSHETTALCIETLDALEVRGRRGLDIGAGSGILAIAMHLLGAEKAIAFDNDVDAYAALRDNRSRNHVPEEAMPLFIGSVEALRGGRFDVVTMNIIPEVILPLLGDVVTHLAEGARLILSGILVVKRDEVVGAAAEHSLALMGEREKGEWWCGVFRAS